ncbi:MAG: HNH endonuclease family protein [Thermoplasmatales archaeon]
MVSLLKNKLKFVYHEIHDESLVYAVFEVLNSRGLPVPWFDRLKSAFMGIVFKTSGGNSEEFIDEVHNIWTHMYDILGKRIGLNAESLRFAATLASEECPSKLLSEESAVDFFKQHCMNNSALVIKDSKWIKSVAEAVDKLISDNRMNTVTKIVQARIVATSILLRSDLSPAETSALLRRWENVTFRIYGMFRKDARTSVGDYVRLAWSIEKEKLSLEKILEGLEQIGKEYPIAKAVQGLREKNCYTNWEEEVRYFFCRYEEYLAKERGQVFNNEEWNRIWERSASNSIEHIYPQSRDHADWIHWLGNLMVIPPSLNSSLKDKMPKKRLRNTCVQAY